MSLALVRIVIGRRAAILRRLHGLPCEEIRVGAKRCAEHGEPHRYSYKLLIAAGLPGTLCLPSIAVWVIPMPQIARDIQYIATDNKGVPGFRLSGQLQATSLETDVIERACAGR